MCVFVILSLAWVADGYDGWMDGWMDGRRLRVWILILSQDPDPGMLPISSSVGPRPMRPRPWRSD
jgi:hypothetical protein